MEHGKKTENTDDRRLIRVNPSFLLFSVFLFDIRDSFRIVRQTLTIVDLYSLYVCPRTKQQAMKRSIVMLGLCTIAGTAFAQNQPDSIHIVLHENQNGTMRTLDTIVPVSQQHQLFQWMQANGWEVPPPPPPPGTGPGEFHHEIIIEGDSIPHGDHRVMMIHMQGDSMPPPPPGCHRVIMQNGNHPHPPVPPHPPGSKVEVSVLHKDTMIDGKKHVMIIRTEKIILPEGVTAPPPSPPGAPQPPVPPSPPQGNNKKHGPAEHQKELIVYPNPSSSVINVEFEVAANEKTTLRVVDANGKVIYTEEIVESESKHIKREINLDGQSKGAYTVEVKSDKKVIAERVILQ